MNSGIKAFIGKFLLFELKAGTYIFSFLCKDD
jgi:hypothetical protein